MSLFDVTWSATIEGENHEDAALSAAGMMLDPANTLTVFRVKERASDRIVVVDTEGGEAAVIRDERKLSEEQIVEALLADVQTSLTKLLTLAKEPVSLSIGGDVDIEVRPLAYGDNRVCVGRKGWGDTVVNYGHEGLVVDAYPQGEMSSAASFCLYKDDLVSVEEELSGG